ncbi:uncharacterized protein BJ171DRAFT_567648 [Polychytrium aggregatum]|uniref:uncharacterized protein n=1 Tax=Polychytrium aggregatum TaxID=110093 RepID=UPI0022FE9AD3|nr:uncharacterized protein BJ171DRAFT_567648 [Polychytrium aggregatum]KAI9205003.1 hypothetical protein BJ171DRAFT_567648 [Polychytrium aggregatum]
MDFVNFAQAAVESQVHHRQEGGTRDGSQNPDGLNLQLPHFITSAIDKFLDGLKPDLHPRVVTEIQVAQDWVLQTFEDKCREVFQDIANGDFKEAALDLIGEGEKPYNAGQNQGQQYQQNQGQQYQQNQGQQYQQNQGQQYQQYQGQQNQQYQQYQGSRAVAGERGIGGDRGILQEIGQVASEVIGSAAVGGFIGSATKGRFNRDNARDIADQMLPLLKNEIGQMLASGHQTLATQFTEASINHIKLYLHGNITTHEVAQASARDLGGFASNIFGGQHQAASRDVESDEHHGGLFEMFNRKVSEGVHHIRDKVRLSLHQIVLQIEDHLWSLLPDGIRRPLSAIFGNNGQRGIPNDRGIIEEIEQVFEEEVQKLENGLHQHVRGLVSQAHTTLETKAVMHFQDVIMIQVHKVLPNARVD